MALIAGENLRHKREGQEGRRARRGLFIGEGLELYVAPGTGLKPTWAAGGHIVFLPGGPNGQGVFLKMA